MSASLEPIVGAICEPLGSSGLFASILRKLVTASRLFACTPPVAIPVNFAI